MTRAATSLLAGPAEVPASAVRALESIESSLATAKFITAAAPGWAIAFS